MSNAAPWAATAGNKFRELTTPDNPTTKLLAEGVTALSEAVLKLEKIRTRLADCVEAASDAFRHKHVKRLNARVLWRTQRS